MKKGAFKRLTLILLLPLLGCGLYMAESEGYFPGHYMANCGGLDDYVCRSSYFNKDEAYGRQAWIYNQRLYEGPQNSVDNTHYFGNLDRPVFIYENGKVVGRREHLGMEPKDVYILGLGCSINSANDGFWRHSCGLDGGTVNFKFADPDAAQGFSRVASQIKALSEPAYWHSIRAYFFNLLSPLALYFSLSIIALPIIRIGRFVAYGKSPD